MINQIILPPGERSSVAGKETSGFSAESVPRPPGQPDAGTEADAATM